MNQYQEIFITYILPAIASGSIAWIFTTKSIRKKANAEASEAEAVAKGTELDNAAKLINMWREMTEQLRNEMNCMKKECDLQLQELKEKICLRQNCNDRE